MISFNISLPFSIRSSKSHSFPLNFPTDILYAFSPLAYVLQACIIYPQLQKHKICISDVCKCSQNLGVVSSDRNPKPSYWCSENCSLTMLPHKIILSLLRLDSKTNIFGAGRKQTRSGDALPPQYFTPLCTHTSVSQYWLLNSQGFNIYERLYECMLKFSFIIIRYFAPPSKYFSLWKTKTPEFSNDLPIWMNWLQAHEFTLCVRTHILRGSKLK
jgi:hypothetical protein